MKIPKARQLASGSWFIQLRLDGESIPITADTEAKCQAEALAVKSGLKKVTRHKGTLRYAIDVYIDSKRGILSPSTIRNYVGYAKNHFQAYMDKDMTAVDWQRAVNAETCSPKTLKNVWTLAQSAMAEQGFTPRVRLPKVVKKPMEWLTPEQIPRFMDAVYGLDCELPALLGLHSLRRSEMYGLTWDNIDLTDALITVKGALVVGEGNARVSKETNKTARSARAVPVMIPRLRELLEAVEDKTGPVLRSDINTPYTQINRACRAAGLPEVGVHGLRRSFASLGYSLGMNEEEIMSIGGWSDFQTVHNFYIYLSDIDRKKAANKMTMFYSDGRGEVKSNDTVSLSSVVQWMRDRDIPEAMIEDFVRTMRE